MGRNLDPIPLPGTLSLTLPGTLATHYHTTVPFAGLSVFTRKLGKILFFNTMSKHLHTNTTQTILRALRVALWDVSSLGIQILVKTATGQKELDSRLQFYNAQRRVLDAGRNHKLREVGDGRL
ncbi:hypothetical protein ACJX0J_026121 [Zea mays]